MKRSIPIFALAVLFGCSQDNGFRKFSDTLPVLDAPIKFANLGLIRYQSPQEHDPELFTKFAPQGTDKVLGKLYEDDSTISIVYLRSGDIDTPVMMTYSVDGIKLDSLNLFYVDPENRGAEVRRLVILSADRSIQTLDSVLLWSEIFTEREADITQPSSVQTLSLDTVIRVVDAKGKIITKD